MSGDGVLRQAERPGGVRRRQTLRDLNISGNAAAADGTTTVATRTAGTAAEVSSAAELNTPVGSFTLPR